MTLPNFLIVGAAKSGTTSLFSYLGQHPEIFVPVCKEPHYFSDSQVVIAKSDEEYEGLFADRTTEKAVGEASVSYLCDPEAPRRIKQTLGDVKIIIILREPVARAYSQWGHLYNIGAEPLSFEEALRQEEARMASEEFRKTCLAVHHGLYYYFHTGLYYEQVKRYFDTFGPERVKVIIFEEFIKDPARFCKEIFVFLGVDPEFSPVFERHNPSHTFKNKFLHNFLTSPPKLLKAIYEMLPMGLRVKAYGVLKSVYWANMRRAQRRPLDKALRIELMERYREDVRKLEKLLNRNLSIWYAGDG